MNKLNDNILNHRILQKLIEMNLISQNEVRRLITEELANKDLLEEAPKDTVSNWLTTKLRKIEDPVEKLKEVEKLLGFLDESLTDNDAFEKAFPKIFSQGEEKIRTYREAIAEKLASWAPDGNPKSISNRLRAAAAGSASPKEKVEVAAAAVAVVAKEESTPVTLAAISTALTIVGGDRAANNKEATKAIVALAQKITGEPVEGTGEEPDQRKAGVSNDPNLFDLNREQIESLKSAYKPFRNDFYGTTTLAKQGEIVREFKQALKAVSEDEDKEAGYERTSDAKVETPPIEEQEDEQVRLKRLPNFKSDVRIFYDNARRSKESLNKFYEYTKGGKKIGNIYKQKLIRLITQLQKSTGRLAKDIDKLIGMPEEAITEIMSAEEKYENAQQVERVHTEIVTSFDDLFKMLEDQLKKPREEPTTKEISEELTSLSKDAVDMEIKKIYGLLNQIVGFFPNVQPFAGTVDFEELEEEYRKALEDLDFSVSNLRTLNQDSIAEGTLIDLRERLKLFSEKLEEIFAIKAEVPGASPQPSRTEPLQRDPSPPSPEEKGQEAGAITTRDPDAPTGDQEADEEGDEEVARLKDGTFAPQSTSQLSTWFKTKIFKAPMIKAEIKRLFPDGKGVENLAKFIAYVLIYKNQIKQDVQENTYHRTVLKRFMGIPENKIGNFFTDLKRREAPVHDFFVQLANSEKESEKVGLLTLFKRVNGYLDDNPVDVSKIDISRIKRAQLTDTGGEEAEKEQATTDPQDDAEEPKSFKTYFTNKKSVDFFQKAKKILNFLLQNDPPKEDAVGQLSGMLQEKEGVESLIYNNKSYSLSDLMRRQEDLTSMFSRLKGKPEVVNTQNIINKLMSKLQGFVDIWKVGLEKYSAPSASGNLGIEEPLNLDQTQQLVRQASTDAIQRVMKRNPDASNEEILGRASELAMGDDILKALIDSPEKGTEIKSSIINGVKQELETNQQGLEEQIKLAVNELLRETNG